MNILHVLIYPWNIIYVFFFSEPEYMISLADPGIELLTTRLLDALNQP